MTTPPPQPSTIRGWAPPALLALVLGVSGAMAGGVAPAQASAPGTITGLITQTGGVPTTGTDVYLETAAGEFLADTVTNAFGRYSFAGLEPGAYKLEFENQSEAAIEWYDNKPDRASATVVTLGSGQTFTADAYLTTGSENTSRPTVNGTAAVGQTLTSTLGTWFPTPNFPYTHQWLRQGVEIPGATGTTYAVTGADAGSTISVRVTSNRNGTLETAVSAATATVPGGVSAIVAATPPTITGATGLGSTLSSTSGTWTPSDVQVTRQWLRGGAPIAGATATTYQVAAVDQGTSLSVRITATRSGYTSATQTSAPVAVPGATAFVGTPPVVSGTPQAGATLSATTGSWTPTPAAIALTWRDADGGGVLQTGGTTYALTGADVGRRIQVAAVASGPGHTATTLTSSATAVVTAAPVVPPVLAPANLRAPRVTGTARVGTLLRADAGAWSLPSSYRYSWRRNGQVIPGATAATYRLAPADAGKRIQVGVLATAGARSTLALGANGPVTAKATSRLRVVAAAGKGRTRLTITLTTAGARNGKVAVKVRNGARTVTRVLTIRNGVARTTVTGLKKGARAVTATYRGNASSSTATARTQARVR